MTGPQELRVTERTMVIYTAAPDETPDASAPWIEEVHMHLPDGAIIVMLPHGATLETFEPAELGTDPLTARLLAKWLVHAIPGE